MDRFIGTAFVNNSKNELNLKSNMDRFIADTYHNNFVQLEFKIQYG